MKKFELRELSSKDLAEKIGEKKEELANLKFQHALHQLENTATVRLTKRELSRMKTILQEHNKGIRKLTQESLADEEL